MVRSRVWFIPANTNDAHAKLYFSIEAVLAHRAYALVTTFLDGDLVGIKLPYGEDKTHLFADAALLKAFVSALKQRNRIPFLCDTAARHLEKRANAVKHLERYLTCGVNFEHTGAPLAMLDGINGGYELAHDPHGRRGGEKALLAGELQNLDGLVILSTPIRADDRLSEGALFNLGVGLASKRGKIQLYSNSGPRVNVERCYLCKKCIYICPVGAIRKGPSHVVIDQERCINCGKCVDLTRFGGISYQWNATEAEFSGRLLRGALAVHQLLRKKLIYCSILLAAPHHAPCHDGNNTNIGVLLSKDPVAIDKAALDLLGFPHTFDAPFTEQLLRDASEAHLGSPDYSLVTVAY